MNFFQFISCFPFFISILLIAQSGVDPLLEHDRDHQHYSYGHVCISTLGRMTISLSIFPLYIGLQKIFNLKDGHLYHSTNARCLNSKEAVSLLFGAAYLNELIANYDFYGSIKFLPTPDLVLCEPCLFLSKYFEYCCIKKIFATIV